MQEVPKPVERDGRTAAPSAACRRLRSAPKCPRRAPVRTRGTSPSRRSRTLPDLPDDVGVGVGERAAARRRLSRRAPSDRTCSVAGSSMTPSLTPSIASHAAIAAAVAASNLHCGTKFFASSITTCPHSCSTCSFGQLIAGAPREDAVVVRRVALRFHQALASAGGAAVEVRIARRVAVERPRQRLAGRPSSRGCRDRRCRESTASSGGPPRRARSCRCRLRDRCRSRPRRIRRPAAAARRSRCRRRSRRRRRPETVRSSSSAAGR